jgi:hypothetical protein
VLEVDGVTVTAHDAKVTALTAYYTDILGGESVASWNFDLDRLYSSHERVDVAPLIAPFKADEAHQAVHAMCADNAPGPDGVSPGFCAAAWGLTRAAVMEFLNAFHEGNVDLQRINRALIVLIPKTPAAITPSVFRPVSL